MVEGSAQLDGVYFSSSDPDHENYMPLGICVHVYQEVSTKKWSLKVPLRALPKKRGCGLDQVYEARRNSQHSLLEVRRRAIYCSKTLQSLARLPSIVNSMFFRSQFVFVNFTQLPQQRGTQMLRNPH